MIVFGKHENPDLTSLQTILDLCALGRQKALRLCETPILDIINTLDAVGKQFLPESRFYRVALEILKEDSGFSATTNELTLNLLPGLLSKDALLTRIKSELGDERQLDRFVKTTGFNGQLRAVPLGLILHITAGNVFLSAIDSLIQGFLTKNVSFLKPGSSNRRFPELVADAFMAADPTGILSDCFCILQYKGGDVTIENNLLAQMDGVIAWGGADSLTSIKHRIPAGVRLLEFGPRISFQTLSRKAFASSDLHSLARKLAHEVCLWDQAACASPQNLFLEEGVDIKSLLDALTLAFDSHELERGPLSADQALEMHKESLRALIYSELYGGSMRQGKDYLLYHDPKKGLKASGLCRTLILKKYRDCQDLLDQVKGMGRYLQSCSLAVTEDEKAEYMKCLSLAGVKRFTAPGQILNGQTGTPHDGQYPLRELVHLISDEQEPDVLTFLNQVIPTIPAYAEKYQAPIRSLSEVELTDKSLYQLHSPHLSQRYLKSPLDAGVYFASGGTTGAPKFTFYAHDEFAAVSQMLAHSYLRNGLKAGCVAANLFVAGNLWSSFLAVHQALQTLDVRTLPIGGSSDPELILRTLQLFQSDAIFGLPSLLRILAQRALDSSMQLNIPLVFYAGEHMSQNQMQVIRDAFSCTRFVSAGYASVDAGPIGWQCPYLSHGDHHLHADKVTLEIIDEEAVVTSLVKRNFPVIRYRTGDRVQWLHQSSFDCACGSSEPVFRLLDRVDNQFRFLSSTISLHEVATLLALPISELQIIITPDQQMRDVLKLYSTQALSEDTIEKLYAGLEDLNSTVSLHEFQRHIELFHVEVSEFERNPRTGKTPGVLDKRIRTRN